MIKTKRDNIGFWLNIVFQSCLMRLMTLFRRRRHKKKTRLLIIDDRIPDPALGYGYPRTLSIIQYLCELGYAVTFLPLQLPEKIEPYTSLLQQKGIEIIYGAKEGKIDFKEFYLKRNNYYDVVWISRPHNMRAIVNIIKRISPKQKIIYDAEALFSVREILRLELDGINLIDQEKRKMFQEEIGLMSQADAVITVSETERSLINKDCVKNVSVLGHCYDIKPTPTPFEHRNDILFVGAFLDSTTPNEDAVKYFVNEIYPKVYKATGAKFFIVGTNYSEPIKKLHSDKIIVTGRVDNLYWYFDKCRVFVVPTRYSAGISLKLLECLSFGLPAVVTPLIAKQLGIDKNVVLIGDTSDDFAAKVTQCYTDNKIWQSLRDKGLEYVEKECSPAGYRNKLHDIISVITD